MRRQSREFAMAASLAAGITALTPSCAPEKKQAQEETQPYQIPEILNEDAYFTNPAFFVRHERGSYTPSERKDRTNKLKNGEIILHDAGLDFYLVKSGDSIEGIRQKLGRYPKYSHVLDERMKIKSFNIPNSELVSGMLLPIPISESERIISERDFVIYALRTVRDLREDPEFGDDLRRILKKISEKELIATLLATAKQESGGKPLGQFSLHRWEPPHNRFSFSHFHILMKDAGLEARKKLDMTEGQTYHPENACKLFIVFLTIKSGGNLEKLLPIDQHYEEFATFYNGRAWRRTNPHYVINIKKFYEEALLFLDDSIVLTKKVTEQKVIKPVIRVERTKDKPTKLSVSIGERNILTVLKELSSFAKEENIYLPTTDNYLSSVEEDIRQYTKQKYKERPNILPTDRISIIGDTENSSIIYTRDGEENTIKINQKPTTERKEQPTSKPETRSDVISIILKEKSLLQSIKDINFIYTKKFNKSPIRLNKEFTVAENKLEKYLLAIYGNKEIRTNDELSIGIDAKGSFLQFRRGDRSDTIRIDN